MTAPLQPHEAAALIELIDAHTSDLGIVDHEGAPELATLQAIRAKLASPAPSDPVDSDAHAQAVGETLAHLFRLPRIRTGPDAGRYRTAAGVATARALARTVARLMRDPLHF